MNDTRAGSLEKQIEELCEDNAILENRVRLLRSIIVQLRHQNSELKDALCEWNLKDLEHPRIGSSEIRELCDALGFSNVDGSIPWEDILSTIRHRTMLLEDAEDLASRVRRATAILSEGQ